MNILKSLPLKNKRHTVILAGFLVVLVLIGAFSKTIFSKTDIANAGRIIDGTANDEKDAPNVARLMFNDNTLCTGTLIDTRHVLTAAHCFYHDDIRRVGDRDLSIRLNGVYFQSIKVYIHPDYDYKNPDLLCYKDSSIDVAIVELVQDVPAAVATPANLLTTKVPVNASVILAGYGVVGNHGANLYSLDTPPLGKIYAGAATVAGFGTGPDNPNPKSNYIYWVFNEANNESTTAPGDSGGPSFYEDKVVSVNHCGTQSKNGDLALEGFMGSALRVDVVYPWIKSILKKRQTEPTLCDSKEITTHKPNGIVTPVTIDRTDYCLVSDISKSLEDTGNYSLWSVLLLMADPQESKPALGVKMESVVKEFTYKITSKKTPADSGEFGSEGTQILRDYFVKGSYSSPSGKFFDPGGYEMEVWHKGKKIASQAFCLPSKTSSTGKKIGNIKCEKAINNSEIAIDMSVEVTMSDPIFIKGTNNDIAQFNVPVFFGFPVSPSYTEKVDGYWLGAVIYKKNEKTKLEDAIIFDGKKDVYWNTRSLFSYQWSGLVPGNEYVIYFYHEAPESKSSYISLKYGSDGKLNATKISSLPSWASSLTTTSAFPNSNTIQTGSAVGSDGTKMTFTVSKAELVQSGDISITGITKYDKSLTGSQLANKVGAIEFNLIDVDGSAAGTATGIISNAASDPKSFTTSAQFSNIALDKGPYKFKIKDTDSGASIPIEFTIDQSETIIGVNQSATWYDASSPVTADGTSAVFTDPTFTFGDDTSVTVSGLVNYKNTSKTGTVTNPAVFARFYNIDIQGKQSFNKNIPIGQLAASYNQQNQFSKVISGLSSGNKYAVQFVDTAYGNATSTAKIIENKNGKFVASDQKPLDNTVANDDASDTPDTPDTPGNKGIKKLGNLTNFGSIQEVVAAFVDNIVIPIAVPLLGLAIIYTGFLFVQARGNPEKLKEAKRSLLWTLIGAAIILGAYVITDIIQGTITGVTD